MSHKPVRETLLPYGQQWITDEDIQAVVDVLKSPYLTTGPNVKTFEEKVAQYVGAKYAVAVSNGTTALHAACFAAGIGPGDEVITTPMTFAASANCVLYMGGTPVFADIDPYTYNIDPKDILKKITPRTKAIIPVDYTGQPCNYEEILKIAKEHNLIIIQDAAHALGADYAGKRVGSFSDMTEFSFHPVKHITTGEGGMITTNDEVLYKKLLLFRTHGITRDTDQMFQNDGGWYYEQLALGNNYRITDVQCALGSSQMTRMDAFVARRREIADIYNAELSGISGITIPYQANEGVSSWHLYVIQIDPEVMNRKEFYDQMLQENIGLNVHYIPVYYHPYYQQLGYKKGLCPNAERLYERIVSLPMFPKMTDQDVADVVKAIKKVLKVD